MIKLRPYQAEGVMSVFDYYTSGKTGNPVIALPTGTGKSLVIADFCRTVLHNWPNQKIICLTHVKELVEQNAKAMLKVWPTAPVGIYSAGLGSRDTMQSIIFGGVASVIGSLEKFGLRHLMIIDEAHLVSPKAESMYQKVIEHFKKLNPNFKVIGLTATAYRTGQGPIAGIGKLFTDVCYDRTDMRSFNWFIEEGFIVPLIPKRTMTEFDVSNLSVVNGDYSQADQQKAFDVYGLTYQCSREMVEYAAQRKSWLIFASGVEHSEHVAECLQTLGIRAVHVHSKMTKAERDERITSFKNGAVRCIVNNGVLTTGFDHPALDFIGVMRATTSTGLWVQMLGRGTRPLYMRGYDLETKDGRLAAIAHSYKRNCLVLDFAGNTRRLGPINDPVIPTERVKGSTPGVAPIKICPSCGVYNHASASHCENPACGLVFEKQSKLQSFASQAELIRTDTPILEEMKVDRVLYTKMELKGKPPMLKVSYFCGLDIVKEVKCFEHIGFARTAARQWWRLRCTDDPPETIDAALDRQQYLREPRAIKVQMNLKNPTITEFIW